MQLASKNNGSIFDNMTRYVGRQASRQRDRETERQRYRETERQRDRETERQRDRETERQRDRETEKLVGGTINHYAWTTTINQPLIEHD